MAGIAEPRLSALAAGKAAMVEKLQGTFNATNGGTVLQNVLSFYGTAPFHGLDWVKHSTGAMAEHFAVFESVYSNTGKLNVTRVTAYLDTVSEAARRGKMVVMGTWPGQYVGVMKWFNDTQPKPNDLAGWRAALLQKHTFALAGYLTVATPLVYMQYEMWYEGFSGGAVPCPSDPSSCPAPDPWYPDLFKPLGAPLGPAVRTGNVFVRHFQHATSTLDLDDPDASTVVFVTPPSASVSSGYAAVSSASLSPSSSSSPVLSSSPSLPAPNTHYTGLSPPLTGPICTITDHGAVGDNTTLATKAIQATVDACHAAHPTGCTVLVPPGAYRTGGVLLRSNLRFHIAAGAGLYGSPDPGDYPISLQWFGGHRAYNFNALMRGVNLTNVSVTGSNDFVGHSPRGVEGASIVDG